MEAMDTNTKNEILIHSLALDRNAGSLNTNLVRCPSLRHFVSFLGLQLF